MLDAKWKAADAAMRLANSRKFNPFMPDDLKIEAELKARILIDEYFEAVDNLLYQSAPLTNREYRT